MREGVVSGVRRIRGTLARCLCSKLALDACTPLGIGSATASFARKNHDRIPPAEKPRELPTLFTISSACARPTTHTHKRALARCSCAFGRRGVPRLPLQADKTCPSREAHPPSSRSSSRSSPYSYPMLLPPRAHTRPHRRTQMTPVALHYRVFISITPPISMQPPLPPLHNANANASSNARP